MLKYLLWIFCQCFAAKYSVKDVAKFQVSTKLRKGVKTLWTLKSFKIDWYKQGAATFIIMKNKSFLLFLRMCCSAHLVDWQNFNLSEFDLDITGYCLVRDRWNFKKKLNISNNIGLSCHGKIHQILLKVSDGK